MGDTPGFVRPGHILINLLKNFHVMNLSPHKIKQRMTLFFHANEHTVQNVKIDVGMGVVFYYSTRDLPFLQI